MKQLQYLFFKLLSKVFHNNEIKHNFLRRQGIQIGGGGGGILLRIFVPQKVS